MHRAPGRATPSAIETQRRRPVWLATALAFLSGGLYYTWWLGATWSELKRELGDETMRPVWHGLTSLVPVYATFRTHAHFRTIDAAAAGLTIRSGSGAAAALNAAAWITGVSAGFLSGWPQALAYVATATLYGWLTNRGQTALESYWTALSGRQIPERTHGFEWFALALSALGFLGIIGAPLATPTP